MQIPMIDMALAIAIDYRENLSKCLPTIIDKNLNSQL